MPVNTKLSCVLPCLLCLCALLGRQYEAEAQTYLYNLKDLKITPRHTVDTIPISIKDNRIYVTLRIGNRDYRFLLDTGAALGELYAESGIAPGKALGRLKGISDALGIERGGEMVTLPDFQIGKLHVSNYPIQHSPPMKKGQSADGTCGSLGFALFNKGVEAKIDTRRGVLILATERGSLKQEPGVGLSYTLYRHTPRITLQLSDGTPVEAILDTGNPHFFFMGREAWDTYAQKSPEQAAHSAVGRGLVNEIMAAHGREAAEPQVFLQLPQLQWGSYSFCNVQTRTISGPSYLCAALLKHGSLIILPKQNRLLFQPYEASGNVCVEPSFIKDVYYAPDASGRARIGYVRPGSKPHLDGCRTGDLILRINDRDIPDYATFVKTLQRFMPGQVYVMTMRSPIGIPHMVTMSVPAARSILFEN